MEENVALDSSRQKQFVKSIKGIKKFIKKKPVDDVKESDLKTSDGLRKKKKFKGKGLVYLSHIPHGFYEHQMTQYFKQFGRVTNARVIRSKRTGNSKGCAFVEFVEPSVAQIVAETMNNYLMGKRLLKAAYIPPEKQRKNVFRKHWSAESNPAADHRNKLKKAFNKTKTNEEELKKANKLLKNLSRTKKQLAEIGIDYDFFKPVDVPDALDSNKRKAQDVIADSEGKPSKIPKKDKTDEEIPSKKSKTKLTSTEQVTVPVKKLKANKKALVATQKHEKALKKTILDEKKIKPMQNFIQMKQVESDSSVEFDSDEFFKSINEDSSDVVSGQDSDEEDENVVPGFKSSSVELKVKKSPKKLKKIRLEKSNGLPKKAEKKIKKAEAKVPVVAVKKEKLKKQGKGELSRFSNKKQKNVTLKNKKMKK